MNNNNNNNNIGNNGALEDEKEGMFEKPLTPSDVGKLNRLVIPKQHAEKYFPLADLSSSDPNTKGVSLSFEDESGKCWRFRYSYWNSSQSYVLTKGWSRYVKDKRLHAGDVVFFLRHRTHSNRLFIHWRRRPPPPPPPPHFYSTHHHHHPYPTHPHAQPHSLHAGGVSAGDDSKATSLAVGNSTSRSTSSRVLRLFGVNMECQPDQSGSSIPEYSYVSSSTPTQHHHFYAHHNYFHQPSFSSSNPMDINQMRNRRG